MRDMLPDCKSDRTGSPAMMENFLLADLMMVVNDLFGFFRNVRKIFCKITGISLFASMVFA